jgi:hypothetical protein
VITKLARVTLCIAIVAAVARCGGDSPTDSSDTPTPPVESPPVDSTPNPPIPPVPPPDTTTPPPPGPPTPPPDTTTPPPPDTTTPPPPEPPPPPAPPAVHHGIPFGPTVFTKSSSSLSRIPPVGLNRAFTGLLTDAHRPILIAKLEEARRTNGRVLLSFSGSPSKVTDQNGFNLAKWKQLVDEYRGFDFSPYIADGTLMGHFIMDEPSDPSNWNGKVVPLSDIDEMARYSKEIWPELPAIIRAWPDYVEGYNFRYLDAVWAQYHSRFGSLDDFIDKNVRLARASGLALVMGLNVVAGGNDPSMKGYHNERLAMTAAQVRQWGDRILDEPYICAFFMFRFNPDYFNRPDIQAVMDDLSNKASARPIKECRRS